MPISFNNENTFNNFVQKHQVNKKEGVKCLSPLFNDNPNKETFDITKEIFKHLDSIDFYQNDSIKLDRFKKIVLFISKSLFNFLYAEDATKITAQIGLAYLNKKTEVGIDYLSIKQVENLLHEKPDLPLNVREKLKERLKILEKFHNKAQRSNEEDTSTVTEKTETMPFLTSSVSESPITPKTEGSPLIEATEEQDNETELEHSPLPEVMNAQTKTFATPVKEAAVLVQEPLQKPTIKQKPQQIKLPPYPTWQELNEEQRQTFKETQRMGTPDFPLNEQTVLQSLQNKESSVYAKILVPLLNLLSCLGVNKTSMSELKQKWMSQMENIHKASKVKGSTSNTTTTFSVENPESFYQFIEYIRFIADWIKEIKRFGISLKDAQEQLKNLKIPSKMEIDLNDFPTVSDFKKLIENYASLKKQNLPVAAPEICKKLPTEFQKGSLEGQFLLLGILSTVGEIKRNIENQSDVRKSYINFPIGIPAVEGLLPILSITPSAAFTFIFKNTLKAVAAPPSEEMILKQGIQAVEDAEKKEPQKHDAHEKIKKELQDGLAFAKTQPRKQLANEVTKLAEMIKNDLIDSICAKFELKPYVQFLSTFFNFQYAIRDYAAAVEAEKNYEIEAKKNNKLPKINQNLKKKTENAAKKLDTQVATMILEGFSLGKKFATEVSSAKEFQKVVDTLDQSAEGLQVPQSWIDKNFFEWVQENLTPYFKDT